MTAAEIIAEYDRLQAEILSLKAKRDNLAMSVAMPWAKWVRGYWRVGLRNSILCSVTSVGGKWQWSTFKSEEYFDAEPNTLEGAKACAEAHLLADGVLLA